ncbi:MAG: hypothetical protein KA777_08725, partial [Rhodoferax sp.]|nr:hypothetical protein [Rhodoferax sp.]MBP8135593.1 hypothetical protein [Rhodoferax sp.]
RSRRGAGTCETQASSAVAAQALLLARGSIDPCPARRATSLSHRAWACQSASNAIVICILPIVPSKPSVSLAEFMAPHEHRHAGTIAR